MNVRVLGLAVFLIGLTSSASLSAEVVPVRWEKVDALAAGTSIVVTLKSTGRNKFRFSSNSAIDLMLDDPAGETRTFPKSEVERVTLPPEQDGVTDGTMIGLGVGAASGAAVGVAVAEDLDNVTSGSAILFGLIWAGAGALTGAVVDSSIRHTDVLYQAK